MKPDTNETSRSESNVYGNILLYNAWSNSNTLSHFNQNAHQIYINAIPSMHLSINKALSKSTKTTTIH